MKVYLRTYGCQMNERDSEHIAADFAGRGWEIAWDILALLGLLTAILALSGGSFTPFIYQQF